MPPWCGIAVYTSAANLVRAGSGIFAPCSAPRAQSQQRDDSLACQRVPPSAAEFLSLNLSAPGSSGTQELGGDLELPSLDISQHSQKCTQRIQHSAQTPAFWEKLLITNIITATTDQRHDLITLRCTFNKDYLKLSLCTSFPVLSRAIAIPHFCAALQRIRRVCFIFTLSCATFTGIVAVK